MSIAQLGDVATNGAAAATVPNDTGLSFNAQVRLPESGRTVGTGCIRDTPDLRDYTTDSEPVVAAAEKLGLADIGAALGQAPAQADLRPWCSPIEDQGALGSCTAHAAVGVAEYFEQRTHGRYIRGSRLFVYKATRKLLGLVGDTGASLRMTMGALVMLGIPPERYWPYTDRTQPGTEGGRTFDDEPTTFVYELAHDYETIKYFRHDPPSVEASKTLDSVKAYIAKGVPALFGFYVFPSLSTTDVPGGFPYPCPYEAAIGGHAVVAVGYDDNKVVGNTRCGQSTTGALLIRNSWSSGWGEQGYGWLPYRYVLDGFAWDFWSLIDMNWIESGPFGI